jgi:gluconolactonase
LFFEKDGTLLACADEKNELWAISPDKTHRVLLSNFEDKLLNGPNDLWVNSDGSLFFTDPYYRRPYWDRGPSEQSTQGVYWVSPDRKQVRRVIDNLKQPNGIIGDADKGILYVADIGDGKTYRYKIGEEGSLSDAQLFCRQGSDGMTMDREGNVYLTGGKGVTVFDPQGRMIEVIKVPERWSANVTFGGPQRRTLFITSSDSLYSIEMRTEGM